MRTVFALSLPVAIPFAALAFVAAHARAAPARAWKSTPTASGQSKAPLSRPTAPIRHPRQHDLRTPPNPTPYSAPCARACVLIANSWRFPKPAQRLLPRRPLLRRPTLHGHARLAQLVAIRRALFAPARRQSADRGPAGDDRVNAVRKADCPSSVLHAGCDQGRQRRHARPGGRPRVGASCEGKQLHLLPATRDSRTRVRLWAQLDLRRARAAEVRRPRRDLRPRLL